MLDVCGCIDQNNIGFDIDDFTLLIIAPLISSALL